MTITHKEKQKRIESLKGEPKAIDKLNDLSDLHERVKKEKPIVERTGIEDNLDKQKSLIASELLLK